MTQITGCPAQGTGVQCYERCQDARMAGESRLCEGTEFDPTAKHFTIDGSKLEAVTRIVNAEIDPAVTSSLVEDEICADWGGGAGHQAWITRSSPQVIADWLATFYQS